MRSSILWIAVITVGCADSLSEDGANDKANAPLAEDSGTFDDASGGDEGGGAEGGDGDGDGGSGGDDGGGTGDEGGSDGAGDEGGSGDSGDGGSEDGGAGDDGGTGEEPPPALPAEGDWSLAASALVRDDCGVADYQDPGGFIAEAYDVLHVDDETFSLAADGEPPGDCAVGRGSQFTCASAQVRQNLSDYGINADMVVDTVFSGTFSSDYRSMTGTTDVVVTCDGDCWLLEFVLSFPCDMAIDMDLAAD